MRLAAAIPLACALALACEGPVGAVANPASAHCGKLKGKSVVFEGEKGQIGYCRLPDGSLIDEWSLFRAPKAKKPVKAAAAFLEHAAPAKASPTPEAYCAQLGGLLLSLKSREGGEKFCRFSDRSSIDAKSLLEGPKKRPELASVLKKG